ncbi:transcriptional regulator [Bacillus sp. AFS015802]|uniref:LysR family transcriptional regulator n=1 Tax=Bacillus sp. AFS015802 TaxID=2033486 RepID=UPI000BF583B4|nr:LysR family transcriptional regulator [Bacillus sp. AFS015802]PFA63360.1 transcriptional regulator [Bacillus sp. AFS015802]
MESHDLRIFKAVADLGSISAAAEKLGYVQPNVSQRIKGLEEELGVRLLKRTNRGVTLTTEGTSLLEYTEQILHLMEEAKTFINPSKWRESLTIGASQTISAVKIPQLFTAFLQAHHTIDLKLKTQDKQKLQDMLYYGELDGLFLHGPYRDDQFEAVHSYFEEIVLLSSRNRPPGKEPLLLVNSDPSCIYRNKTLHLFEGKDPLIMELDSLESILQAVEDGLGMSILPSSVMKNRNGLHSEPLPEKIRIDFLIRKRKQKRKSLVAFILFLSSLEK